MVTLSNRYKAYLKSPAWAAKRQLAFNYYGRKCYACGTRRGPLQIHHITYARLYHEAMRDIRPLCVTCHREVTRLHWTMGKKKDGAVVFSAFMAKKKAQKRSQSRRK